MFTTILRLWTILLRRMRKKSTYSIPSHITFNNCLPPEKKDDLKGTRSIGHCR